MNDHSGNLFEFAADFARRPLSPALADAAALRLTDTLGCAVYGGGQEWTQILLKTVSHARGNATAFGSRMPLAAEAAALCNGTAAHGFELDDLLTDALAHPGAVVVPAVLAVAEEEEANGADILKAIVAGYEVVGRLGRALGPQASGRGWHLTGVAGPAASAVGVGVLLGFDACKLANAVGIACASAGGNKSFTGSGGMVKRLHAGLASRAGVVAARLAASGFTGPAGALDGQFGLLDVVAGAGKRAAELDARLGETFEILQTTVKIYPCCAVLQSTLQALVTLQRDAGLRGDNFDIIKVGSSERAVTQNNERKPADIMAAQYSLPFCTALALQGDPEDPRLFSNEALSDPTIRALMDKVTMYVDDRMHAAYPQSMGARVSAFMPGKGEVMAEVLDAHGTARAPCSPAELEAKFKRLGGLAVGDDTAAWVLSAIAKLKQGGNVRTLSESLQAACAYA
jgi:2-methylcitrate dehydratase PrpD